MPKKKLAKLKKPKTKYQKKLDILITEGIRREARLEEANKKLSIVQSDLNNFKQIWHDQEDRMLNQINHLNQRLEFAAQEKSQLQEVISSLGEVLGQNKAEIQRSKRYRQNFLVASEPKNETERR